MCVSFSSTWPIWNNALNCKLLQKFQNLRCVFCFNNFQLGHQKTAATKTSGRHNFLSLVTEEGENGLEERYWKSREFVTLNCFSEPKKSFSVCPASSSSHGMGFEWPLWMVIVLLLLMSCQEWDISWWLGVPWGRGWWRDDGQTSSSFWAVFS